MKEMITRQIDYRIAKLVREDGYEFNTTIPVSVKRATVINYVRQLYPYWHIADIKSYKYTIDHIVYGMELGDFVRACEDYGYCKCSDDCVIEEVPMTQARIEYIKDGIVTDEPFNGIGYWTETEIATYWHDLNPFDVGYSYPCVIDYSVEVARYALPLSVFIHKADTLYDSGYSDTVCEEEEEEGGVENEDGGIENDEE